jgi:TRAP-type C4-dicarboxylate transport system substrate-binding protein
MQRWNKEMAMRSHTFSLTAVLALVAFMASNHAAVAEPVVLKFGSFVSPKSITNEVSVPAFIKEVQAASEGTLKIEHYPGGTLGSNPATQLKLVEDGVLDSAEVVASYTPGRFRELDMFELPFIFNDTREAGLTAWTLYEKRLLSGFDNLVLLGIAEVGPYTLHARKDVSTLAAVNGLKIRAGGPIFGETIKAMGGIPVGGMPATQIAENISRGVLDATLMDGGNLFNFRITDATRYHVLNIQLGNIAVMFPLNKAKYDSLPPKAKAALDKYRGTWFTKILTTNLDKQVQSTLEKVRADPNHKVVAWSDADVSALKQRTSALKAPWDKTVNGVNLYQEMLQALASVRRGS